MKKVIVACFALAMVLDATFASSAQAQLLRRFRVFQNRNCCCQPACSGQSAVGETVATATSEASVGEVVTTNSAATGEVFASPIAQVAYEGGSETGNVGYADFTVAAPAPMAMSYEAAPVSYDTGVMNADCGCCNGCGGGEPMMMQGAEVQGMVNEGVVSQGMVNEGVVTEGAAVQGDVIYSGEPTLATEANTGETIISEEVVSEEAIEAQTDGEATPESAPVSEDSVPDAPKTDK